MLQKPSRAELRVPRMLEGTWKALLTSPLFDNGRDWRPGKQSDRPRPLDQLVAKPEGERNLWVPGQGQVQEILKYHVESKAKITICSLNSTHSGLHSLNFLFRRNSISWWSNSQAIPSWNGHYCHVCIKESTSDMTFIKQMSSVRCCLCLDQ